MAALTEVPTPSIDRSVRYGDGEGSIRAGPVAATSSAHLPHCTILTRWRRRSQRSTHLCGPAGPTPDQTARLLP